MSRRIIAFRRRKGSKKSYPIYGPSVLGGRPKSRRLNRSLPPVGSRKATKLGKQNASFFARATDEAAGYSSPSAKDPISKLLKNKHFQLAARVAITAALKHTGLDTFAYFVTAAVKGYRVFRQTHSLRAGFRAAFSDFVNSEIKSLSYHGTAQELSYLTPWLRSKPKKIDSDRAGRGAVNTALTASRGIRSI